MRAAERRIFSAGVSEFELMKTAATGAAEWIRRVAAGRPVTILCGPGNNGGDGYVIAHMIRHTGNEVTVIAPQSPKTDTAKQALSLWDGPVLTSGGSTSGGVFVDCLFGSGLSRPLSGEHTLLLRDLVSRQELAIALDVPSGMASDTGQVLNDRLPSFDLTLALGAWKYAHWLFPAKAMMGTKRLVPIGIDPTVGAAIGIAKPRIATPAFDSHKYRRGLAAIVGGSMPGASILSAKSAIRSGAGYVKLISNGPQIPDMPDLVVAADDPSAVLSDKRIDAILVGPGLGRDEAALTRLQSVLAAKKPTVFDADALNLLAPQMLAEDVPILATPHDGELDALCRSFAVIGKQRQARVQALATASGMVICAKGPDTIIAAPNGELAIAPPAPSWLSVAGSGDVLAGIAVSRMATGLNPFKAACEAVWLHGEAARLCGPAFTANDLACAVNQAIAKCI